MIVHSTQIHPRDRWCAAFHVRTYLSFCDRVVVAVDESEDFAAWLRSLNERVTTVVHRSQREFPQARVNDLGMFYDEAAIRQTSLDAAMQFKPSLIVFGDADEVPTPDAWGWIREMAKRPQREERWYAHWVTLWGDYRHAIGGDSVWSFQSARGNKKCLMMQPGREMTYIGGQHCGMEPGRPGGGGAPIGEGRYLIDSPKLLHLKYGSAIHQTRPESKLARHRPAEMLRDGRVVDVPVDWLWPGMIELERVAA